MKPFALFALLLAVTVGAGIPSRAALDVDTTATRFSGLELMVVEVDGCLYCALLRQDVARLYEASASAKAVPLSFIDLNEIESEKVVLKSPVESVPTVLLLKNRAEVGRIEGYVGPESFFHSVNHLISVAP